MQSSKDRNDFLEALLKDDQYEEVITSNHFFTESY